MHERITRGRADFPVTIAREFAKRRQLNRSKSINKKMLHMQQYTAPTTYVQRTANPPCPDTATAVHVRRAVWNYDKRDVSYCETYQATTLA